MNNETPASRVKRVRYELKRRNLEVARVETLSPHFKSITFSGEALADFVSGSFDDHIKFMLDADGTDPVRRDYTPRKFDAAARELTIEFAIHSEGRTAQWAAQAAPGQQATIGGPRGSFIIPTDFDWHLLVGDETALPAIHRRLEELPPQARAFVVIQVADAADRRELGSAANAQVQWVSTADAMLDAVRALDLPGGEGYAWCAGEASAMATLRGVLLADKGIDRQAMRVAAYWKRGAAAHHENLAD
ncbi:NADPH-dependent ferric siderophore reductase [Hydrogenophaga crassostreae]|uniref:NADPH-dependent ferric siderophore reductase n=1 Tax=Hydrogenophaga crassostreae TaxID=1763535 RepID=A0A167HCZ0_9BURK|nr:siderophore-interacting protein [Hydrogenophaga crassostreae]AOW12038.1 NADPH-dependent ferric siderophore reductase [Hydrogenophaga crassostreae]OAD40983.1 NADPH-dependent ferric siderophore reductase [Hydrogenophaga crassostreae]